RPPDPAHGPHSQGYGPQDQGYGPQDQQGWTPPPRDPAGKGIAGTLFDMNFDHMVTPKLVKIIYALALVPITLLALLIGWYALAYLQEGPAVVGLVLLVAAPLIWIFQVLMTRVFLEFVINQFKVSEYLRAIKDKD
ncbi:DUF4282 domain-containing protein, partial [Actinomadura sp. 6K520]|uniref:DUF4282 domain-containing protein n=2 Tax=unclassified Actinomadura TaxID=2626254 RepID=UPI0010534885